MDKLIPITVNDSFEQLVSARDLHQGLRIAKDFTSWFKQQVDRLGLKEGADFTPLRVKSTGGRPGADYAVPIDIAKHICMISGGEMASKIRDYFIQVERAWNSPDQVMARALQISQMTISSLQDRIAILAPKAEQHDRFLAADNAQAMAVVAKALGTGRDRLFRFLREQKVLMGNNMPYQQYLDRGYFRVIEKVINMGGAEVIKPQTLVTAKGVTYIAKLLNKQTA